MRKWIIIGTVLFVLCAMLLLAVWNLNSLINRNKDYLLEQAERALGRKVTVGNVAVTLWGGVGVRLNNFTMSDDPAFSSHDFVKAEDLQLNVKLLPLLRRELQIKRLVLHKPVIRIIRNKEGRYNFSTIGREKDKQQGAVKEREPAGKEQNAPPAFLIAVVDISGGDLHYVDHKEGTDFQAKQIDFTVKEFDLNRPFSADLLAALFSEKQNLKLNMKIGPIAPQAGADFNNIAIEGKVDIDPLDIDKVKSAVPVVRAALPKDLALAGVLKIKNLQFQGPLKTLALKGMFEATDASMRYGNSFQKDRGIPLILSADGQLADNVIRLGQAKVKLNALEVQGSGEIRLETTGTAVNVSLTSNRFQLAGWDKMIPIIQDYELSGSMDFRATLNGTIGKGSLPQVRGIANLTKVSAKPPQLPKPIKDLDTTINFTGERAEVKDTTLSLGNARLRLAAQIEGFAPLTLTYKLSTPEIWLADFQTSLGEDQKADVINNLTSNGTLIAKDGGLTFRGTVASAHGRLYKIDYKDLTTSVVLENKIASIRKLRATTFNGSVQAEGEYAYNNPRPRFSLASQVQRIDLGDLYRSLDPQSSRDIQGRLTGDITVSGSGKDWNEIKPSLRGQGRAEVLEGALLDFNIADGVLSGVTGIPGLTSLINPQVRKKYPETFEAKDTKFKELQGSFILADERVNIADLRIGAANYTVQGSGWVNFEKRTNFQGVLLLSQPLSADLGRSAREVTYAFNNQSQFELPFSLTGILPKVRATPDASYLARMVQRGFLRKGAEELKQRLFGKDRSVPNAESPPQTSERKNEKKKNSTEELIRKGLDQLFGR
jgi:uncharacterized protein involved in outer membrane biogenesis